MGRKIISILIIVILVSIIFSTSPVIGKPSNKSHGKANVGQLCLFEKDPTTWDIIKNGAWGKLKYLHSGPEFDFNFNGHGLLPEIEYSLIYYPDPWPGYGLIVIGKASTDIYGDIKIKGAIIIEDLPTEYDDNYPNGAKIWLVLSQDVDEIARYMIGWNPNYYLFEYDLIKFDSTWEGR